MITNQVLSISPQGQITIPLSWRKSFNSKKNQKIIASIQTINDTQVMTFMFQPKSWTEYSSGLGKEIWQNMDIDKFIAKERDSWT